MGNRAIVKPVDSEVGVYLHWNGGRDSVEAFLKYCELRGFRPFGGKGADGYGIARFMQVVGNFFGGSLSIGLETGVKMTPEYAEFLDNGIYEVDGWNIVGRCPSDIEEQREYELLSMMEEIDSAQPKDEQLGKGFIYGIPVKGTELKRGDKVWVYDEHTLKGPRCRSYTIKQDKKAGSPHRGELYYTHKGIFGSYPVYVKTWDTYRVDTTTQKEAHQA